MTTLIAVVREGGPWAVLLLFVSGTIGGMLFAFSRGILVRGSEVDRIERRIEKDTDRIIDLYKAEIKTLLDANAKKDEASAVKDAQIAKLIDANEISGRALDRIVQEADKRGFFQT